VYPRPPLPEYQLDFGAVILSRVETRSVKARNAGPLPLSFSIDPLPATSRGFNVQLDAVSKLPPNNTVDIPLTFDPRLANLDLGVVEETVVINVCICQCQCQCQSNMYIAPKAEALACG